MKYGVYAFNKLIHKGFVQDSSGNKVKAGMAIQVVQILEAARREIIENRNLYPLSQQEICQVRTDKPSPSRDEIMTM
jgi:hypothetical protein